MDDVNVELTSMCDSSKSIWDKLLSVCEQRSGQRFDRLMENFFRASKVDIDGDIATHITKLQRNFTELNDELKRVAKTVLSDLLLMSRMTTIPQKYFKINNI